MVGRGPALRAGRLPQGFSLHELGIDGLDDLALLRLALLAGLLAGLPLLGQGGGHFVLGLVLLALGGQELRAGAAHCQLLTGRR